MSVAGDEDRWRLLERRSSSELPMVVRSRVNSIIAEFAEQNNVTAIICDVLPKYVQDNGFPSCMDELYEHEDRVVQSVASSGVEAYHTASATGDGRRTIYIAHNGDADFRKAISSIRCDVAEISVFTAFEFARYSDFVTPTKLEVQLEGDQGVIDSLQQNGDEGAQPRKIDFWFYGDRRNLDHLAERLSIAGFRVDHWLDDPSGVVLSLDAPADIESFRELTPTLVDASQDAGVEYDGWETFVLAAKGDEPPPPSKPSLFSRIFGARKH